MKAVFDCNVLVSAVLSAKGPPAKTLAAWREGRFELIVSPELLFELAITLNYPKIVKRLPASDSERFVRMLAADARLVNDPEIEPIVRSSDPDDDYLLALAEQERAALVTGDGDLLALAGTIPVMTPRQFLKLISRS